MSWAYLACMPLLHALMYTMAVLGTCLLRKPFLGGVLAIAVFSLFNILTELIPAAKAFNPINVHNNLLFEERGLSNAQRITNFDLTQHEYPFVFGMMVLTIIAMAIISSRLTKPLQGRFQRP